ncbi:hypothetical protein TorRG33x02_315930 [Trema orientale]|uniref:Uncharacterized protein n=1 Tax=Trema orientale TaxID=63057 RepID=A0A2P5BMB3_TREOI|nr:hypothetical protein TorRG33x02_315930 [Trema orientale]
MGMLGERVDDIDGRCDGLETKDTEIHSGIKDALGELEADLRREIESLYSEIAKIRDLFQRELTNVLLRVDEMGGDLTLCKRAVATGVTTTTTIEARKVEEQNERPSIVLEILGKLRTSYRNSSNTSRQPV